MANFTKVKRYFSFLIFLGLLFSHLHLALAADQMTADYSKSGVQETIKQYLCAPTDASRDQSSLGFGGSSASGDLYLCVNKLYRFALVLASVVGVFFIVLAGYLWMNAEGNQESVDKAKSILTGTITALVILFMGYVLLRAINPDLIKFQPIQPPSVTLEKAIPPSADEGTGGGNTAIIGTTGACPNCVDFSSQLTYKQGDPKKGGLAAGQNTFLNSALVQKLIQLKSKNSNWVITEAYPPTVDHANSCHFNGTCVDIAATSPITADKLKQLCADINSVGFSVFLNEYYGLSAESVGPACPRPRKFQTTTAGHIHLQL